MTDWERARGAQFNADETICRIPCKCDWELELWMPDYGPNDRAQCRGCLRRYRLVRQDYYIQAEVEVPLIAPRCPHCGELLETD
jgi:hypothetical protein